MNFREFLNEVKKIKVGDKYNADGITWEVIKVGKTESRSVALTKSKKGEERVHDNVMIIKHL